MQQLWKIIQQFLKKINIELPDDPAIPGIYPKELKSGAQMDICAPMFRAALFTTTKRWKQSKCSSTNAQINKMWNIMEYQSAFKKGSSDTWMNVKDILLNEIGQSQKDKYCYDSTQLRNLEQSNLQRQKVEWLLPESGARWNGKLGLNGYRVSVWEVKIIL